MFVVASPVDTDAPLASARDTTAIPSAGKALLFEEHFDVAQFSHPFGHSSNRPMPAANRGDDCAGSRRLLFTRHSASCRAAR